MAKKVNDREKMSKLVQYPLLPEDTEKLAALVITEAEFWQLQIRFMAEGWFFDEIKNDDPNSYSVLVKNGQRSSPHCGVGFYARGNSPRAAKVCAFYKLELLGNEGIDDFLSERVGTTSFS